MPKISIITGIFNCESTLLEAIASIQAQIFTDWEWVLCDDGSSDDTLQVASAAAEKDDRLRVIRNERNMGLAATLNHCLKYATGEYIARMDGDDVCPPDRFVREVDFLDNHPEYTLVSGWMACYDEDGVYGVVQYPEKPQHADFVKRSCICHAACMMRRDALLSLGGYHNTQQTMRTEDYDLWVRMYEAGYKAYNLQSVIYSMRDDRNAIKRRKMKYRINESRISYRVFRACKLPLPYIRYALYPLIKGMLPGFVYRFLHKRRLGRSQVK